MDDPKPLDAFPVPLVWTDDETVTVEMTNQILGQIVADNEIIFSFGQVVPPPLLGTPEERLKQMQLISYVPVRLIARLSFTRARLEELARVVNETLENYDRGVTRTEDSQ